MQAIDELAQIVRQRTWDEELLLWSGPEAKLLPALKGLQIETLDLLDLFDPAHRPIGRWRGSIHCTPHALQRPRRADSVNLSAEQLRWQHQPGVGALAALLAR